MLTGAALAVAALEEAGVEVAFGLPGVHNLSLWRELNGSPIRLVGVRHEQTAAYAADGYARATGRLGVALTTTGPGAANTLAAVGEAWASRQPVLVIATDIPASARRPGVWRGMLHEATDQAAMFAPVVKEAYRVTRPEHAGRRRGGRGAHGAGAARAAGLRRDPDRPARRRRGGRAPGRAALPRARAARRRGPPRVAPSSCSSARAGRSSGRAAARSSRAPARRWRSSPSDWWRRCCSPTRRAGSSPPGHPCLVDAPPHVPQVGALWDEADLVVAIGTDFDAMMTQALEAAAAAAPDGDQRRSGGRLEELPAGRAARGGRRRGHRRAGGAARRARRARLARAPAAAASASEVRAEYAESDPEAMGFLAAIENALPADAVVVSDMCIPGYWLGGFHRTPAPRKLSYPLGWGTLGCAFPQGLGAALAGAGPAVSISGDGGFLYACGELAAAKQENIPLTAVIVDDGGYGMIRFDQDRHGDPREGVDLVNPDFVALARSFGVRADHVDGLGEHFAMALKGHVALREPTVLVARAALGPPPNVSPRWYRR